MALPRLPFSGAHWVDSLARHAYSIPDEIAIRFEGASLTWAQFDDRVRRLAAAFAERGVGRGDRVVVLMTNRPEFVEATIAANAVGAIAVPVNFRLTPSEVGYVLRDSGATLVVTDALLAPLAAAAGGAEPVPTLVAGEAYEHAITAADPLPATPAARPAPPRTSYTSG